MQNFSLFLGEGKEKRGQEVPVEIFCCCFQAKFPVCNWIFSSPVVAILPKLSTVKEFHQMYTRGVEIKAIVLR